MSTLQHRLAELFPQPRERGLQAAIQRLCKVKGATVSAWFNLPGKVSTMERAYAELICAKYNPNISPAWLAEGTLPKLLGDGATPAAMRPAGPPAPSAPSGAFNAITADEQRLLDDIRVLMDSDREHYTAEIAAKAAQMREHMEKLLQQFGSKAK